jgi:hypothetical protein
MDLVRGNKWIPLVMLKIYLDNKGTNLEMDSELVRVLPGK